MAIQTIKWGVSLPEPPDILSTTYTAATIDASGEKYAGIFRVPKTGNIRKIVFRVNAVTTSETLRAGLQTVDATTGIPTGTAYGGMAVGTQTSPAAATAYAVTLGTDAAATAGDVVAAVIEFDSAVGNLTISEQLSSSRCSVLPYTALYTSSWSKRGGGCPVMGFEYDDGTYEPCYTVPYSARSTNAYNTGSTPDERALRIYLPFPAKVAGGWAFLSTVGDFDAILYEGTTSRASVSIDKDQVDATGGAGMCRFKFATAYDIAANTEYFLAIKPASGSSVTLHEFDVLSAAAMDSLPGGQALYSATRTDAGAWSTTTTKRPFIGLYLSGFGDDAGGGGGGGLKLVGCGGLAG